jgi:hypothetical protein
MVYLGLDPATRSYLLGTLFDLHVTHAVEVTFMENAFPFRKIKNPASPTSLLWGAEQSMASSDIKIGPFMSETQEIARLADSKYSKTITTFSEPIHAEPIVHDPVTPDQKFIENAKPNEETNLRRSTRVTQPLAQTNQKYRVAGAPPYSLNAVSSDIQGEEMIFDITVPSMVTEATLQTITPRNVHEALKSGQRKMWILAMNREMKCHVKNGTFGREMNADEFDKAVPADWVYKIKYRGGPISISNLTEKMYKARVVIRGQFMREGINFNDTFAPVAKQTSFRALLAFATANGCKLMCGDIETAFLTADMDVETVIKLPPYWNDEEITGD